MASQIKIKRSSVPGNSPTFGTEIVEGELALNTADQKLYSANSTATFTLADLTSGISASDGADNRVAVFTTPTNVEGDNKLTWDGLTLTVNGAITVNTGIDQGIRSPDDSGPVRLLGGTSRDTGARFSIYGRDHPTTSIANNVYIDAREHWFRTTRPPGGSPTFKMLINEDGQVGIGTSTPSQALDVSGTINTSANVHITGAIRDSSGDFGSSGQILSSTGTGITWINDTGATSGFVDTTGTPADDQIAVFTDADTIEGTSTLTLVGAELKVAGSSGRLALQPTSDVQLTRIYFNNTAGTTLGQFQYDTTNEILKFLNGGAERMTILDTGEVGIACTSPTTTLDVAGDASFGGTGSVAVTIGENISTGTARLEIGTGRSGSGYAYVDLVGDTTYTDYGLRIIRENTGANAPSTISHRGTGLFTIKSVEAADILFQTTNTINAMYIDSGGNIGIGTTSPLVQFHLEGATPYIRSRNTGAPTDEETWDFNAGTDGILRFRSTNDAASTSYNWLEVNRTGVNIESIRLLTDTGSEAMRIDSTGQVGINETSPGARLDVVADANEGVFETTSSSNDANANHTAILITNTPSGSQTISSTDKAKYTLRVDTNASVATTGTAVGTRAFQYGIYNTSDTSSTPYLNYASSDIAQSNHSTGTITTQIGGYHLSDHDGAGTISTSYGALNENRITTSGTMSTMIGAENRTRFTNGATGEVTGTLYASYNRLLVDDEADITLNSVIGTYSILDFDNVTAPGSTTTTLQAFYGNIDIENQADVTGDAFMYRGLYAAGSTAQIAGDSWGVFISGEEKNYFSGGVAINTTTIASGYNLDVNGNIATDRIHIEAADDVSVSSTTTDPFRIGATGGQNIAIDNNEIMSRSNGGASTLYLNQEGGNVFISAGSNAATTFVYKLDIGNTLTDSADSVGTSGQVLSSTGSAVEWIDQSAISAGTLDGIDSSSFLRSDEVDFGVTLELSGGSSYDPTSTGGGTDTATDVGLALGTGVRIVGHNAGYIRTLLEWNVSADIVIGQGGTTLIGGIDLLPGNAGDAKVNGSRILTVADEGSGNGLDADTLDGIDSGSFLRSDADDTYTGTLTIGSTSGDAKIAFPDISTIPDSPTNEQYDYITFGAHGSISQISGRGGLMIASSDDSLVLSNGDVGRGFTSSEISVSGENTYILSDSSVYIYTDLQNAGGSGWPSAHSFIFNNSGQFSTDTILLNSTSYNTTSDIAIQNNGVIRAGEGLWLVGGSSSGTGGIYFGTKTVNDGGLGGWDGDVTQRMHIQNDGEIYFSADILPGLASTYDIGASANHFNAIYGINFYMENISSRLKYRVWDSDLYAIGMDSAFNLGGLSDYAMTFQMNADDDRGFWWGHYNHGDGTNPPQGGSAESDLGAMSLTTNGKLYVANSLRLGDGEASTTSPGADAILEVNLSGFHDNLPAAEFRIDDTVGDQSLNALTIDYNVTGSDTLTTDRQHYGLYMDIDSSATGGDTSNEHRVYGQYIDLSVSGDSDLIRGQYNYVRTNHTAGTVTQLIGMYTLAEQGASSTSAVTNLYANYNHARMRGGTGSTLGNLYSAWNYAEVYNSTGVDNLGDITGSVYASYNYTNISGQGLGVNAHGTYSRIYAANTVPVAYGDYTYISSKSGGPYITSLYGHRINFATTGQSSTDSWGLYVNNEDRNYFSGTVLIGTTTTTTGAMLKVDGGSVLNVPHSIGTVTAASVTIDFSNSNHQYFTINTTSAFTINNPSNEAAGITGSIRIERGASWPSSISFGTDWEFEVVPDIAGDLASTGDHGYLDYYIHSTSEIRAFWSGPYS